MTVNKAARPRTAATARAAASTGAAASAEDAAPHGAAPAGDTPTATPTAPPGQLAVRDDEAPWTGEELAGVRADLEDDISRLRAEISVAETDLAGLMRDAGDGAGDDQADAGAKTFEREQEISLADNQREMLEQSEHALERIADGSYGRCESCGTAIGKLRLQAFPRATLCLPCKQKQERR